MFQSEEWQKRYEIIQKNFDAKDFVGLSSLILGLLLSNSAIHKSNPNLIETGNVQRIQGIEKNQLKIKEDVNPQQTQKQPARAIKKKKASKNQRKKTKRVTANRKKRKEVH